MIECTGYMVGDFMCYRCLGGDGVGVFVFVEDGNADDEQYICETCAKAVASGEVLGRMRIGPAPDEPTQ
jgi:hypothetical protein